MLYVIIFIICIVFLLMFIFKDKIRIICYNYWHSISSKHYKSCLSEIELNSKILDVGVGTGHNLIKNSDIIIQRDLTIHGIDIDHVYNNHCYTQILKHNLSDNIKIELKDLFSIKNDKNDKNDKYDYIIFGQSFPVIPRPLMTKMLNHSKHLLNDGGKIIFIHQLDDTNKTNHIFYKIKPYIKYIPFVWIDSGVVTSKHEFEEWLDKSNLNYDYNIIHTDKVLDLRLNIYMYTCTIK